MMTLGKSVAISNSKMHIEPNEWLIPILYEYPSIEDEYLRFEHDKTHEINCENDVLAAVIKH